MSIFLCVHWLVILLFKKRLSRYFLHFKVYFLFLLLSYENYLYILDTALSQERERSCNCCSSIGCLLTLSIVYFEGLKTQFSWSTIYHFILLLFVGLCHIFKKLSNSKPWRSAPMFPSKKRLFVMTLPFRLLLHFGSIFGIGYIVSAPYHKEGN